MASSQPNYNQVQIQIINHYNEKILEQKKIFDASNIEIQRLSASLPKLIQQVHENELTKGKLELFEDDTKIYKISGPCLIPQQKEEAESNIKSRIEAFQVSLKKSEEELKEYRKKQKECSEYVMRLQQEMNYSVQRAQQN